jgi:hypothetical protein
MTITPPKQRRYDYELLQNLTHPGATAADVAAAYEKETGEKISAGVVYSIWTRHKMTSREVNAYTLVPWELGPDRRSKSGRPAQMLRAEARRRAGQVVSPKEEKKLDLFLALLWREGRVVHHDLKHPEANAGGWMYVPRRKGVDLDWIRDPFKDDRGRAIKSPKGLRNGARPSHVDVMAEWEKKFSEPEGEGF